MLAAQEDAVQVDRHHVAPFLEGRCFHVLEDGDAGAVDEHVDGPEVLGRRRQDGDPFLFPAHVVAEEMGVAADVPGHGAARRFVEVGDRHPGAFGGETPRHRGAEARGRAGDQRHLAGHPAHGASPVCARPRAVKRPRW